MALASEAAGIAPRQKPPRRSSSSSPRRQSASLRSHQQLGKLQCSALAGAPLYPGRSRSRNRSGSGSGSARARRETAAARAAPGTKASCHPLRAIAPPPLPPSPIARGPARHWALNGLPVIFLHPSVMFCALPLTYRIAAALAALRRVVHHLRNLTDGNPSSSDGSGGSCEDGSPSAAASRAHVAAASSAAALTSKVSDADAASAVSCVAALRGATEAMPLDC